MSSLSTPLVFCCILRIWQILTELSLTLLCKDMIPGCKVNEWIRTTATLRVMAENFAIDTRRPTEMLYMRRHRLSYSKFQAFHTTMESFTQWAWLKMSIGRPTLHKMIKSAARNINLTSFRFAGNPDWSRHSFRSLKWIHGRLNTNGRGILELQSKKKSFTKVPDGHIWRVYSHTGPVDSWTLPDTALDAENILIGSPSSVAWCYLARYARIW